MAMDEQNPYSAPEAFVADLAEPALRLAGRGERLGASIIDGLILLAILVPAMFVSGYFSGILRGEQPSFGKQLLWQVISLAIFVSVQGYPLSQRGQTWGKKLLQMKIVDLAGNKPDFLRLIALRYGSGYAIIMIPVIGTLYTLVDALFIFRDDKRCIHDHIAGTRVVVAD
jgi:uncharacterized RDD family membrane protein YckC